MDSVRKLIFTCKTFEIDPQHFFLLIPRNHIQNYIFLLQVQYELQEIPHVIVKYKKIELIPARPFRIFIKLFEE